MIDLANMARGQIAGQDLASSLAPANSFSLPTGEDVGSVSEGMFGGGGLLSGGLPGIASSAGGSSGGAVSSNFQSGARSGSIGSTGGGLDMKNMIMVAAGVIGILIAIKTLKG